MSYMFQFCKNLSQLDVSKFITNKVIDMTSLFEDCNSVTYLDVSNFDTSLVTSFERMFSGVKIRSLDLSKFNTKNVKDMSFLFYKCDYLTSADISKFDTSLVTDMRYMFSSTNIINLDLKSFDTRNDLNMNSMFQDNYYLQSLDVSSFDTSKVNDMYKCLIHVLT